MNNHIMRSGKWYIYKMTVLVLAAVFSLSSCTEAPTAEIEPGTEDKAAAGQWGYDGGEYSSADEKSELVTAHADASGRVRDIDVSVELKRTSNDRDADGRKVIRDRTDLTDISSKNGNEEFDKQGEYVYFQDLGEDVSYEGKGHSDLPVSVEIKYYLDGEEMSPSEIKGKKGHVKVEYLLDNAADCEVSAGGALRSACVPFAAVTVVTLEGESGRNIKTKDCRLSNLGSEDMIMAMTMPGMSKNRRYLSLDTSALDVPEGFSFEMDTDSFRLGFSATIVTSDLLDESIDLSDLSDMRSSLGKLSAAAKKLYDAGRDVNDGAVKFKTYLEDYTDAVDGIDSGIDDLYKGIRKLDAGSDRIGDGAGSFAAGLEEMDNSYNEALVMLDNMIEEDPGNQKLLDLKTVYGKLGKKLDALTEGSSQYAEDVQKYTEGLAGIKEGAGKLQKGSSALSGQSGRLVEGCGSLASGIGKYTSGVRELYTDGIKKLRDEGKGKIDDIESFVRMMEEADNMYESYSGLEEGQKGKVTFIIETDEIS